MKQQYLVFTGCFEAVSSAVAPSVNLHHIRVCSVAVLFSRTAAASVIVQDVSTTSVQWHIHTGYGWLEVAE